MITVAELVAKVSAETSQFNAGMGAAEGRLRRAAGTMGSIGSTLTRRVTLPIVAVGAGAVKMSLDFDHSMNQIRSLVGASDTQMQQYRTHVMDLAKGTTQGPKQLADALYFVTSSGFSGGKALDILDASAKASSAGLGSTATVADLVTSAVNAYGESSLSASQATDILTAAVRVGKNEPAELAGALGRVISPAKAMGVSFDQVAGTVASLSLVGLNAAEGVTALRGTLMGIMRPSQQTRKFLKGAGESIAGIRREVAEKGLVPTLGRLAEKFKGNQDAIGTLFPNVRALNAFLALTGANSKKTASALDQVKNSAGETDKAFGKAMQDNQNKLANAWSNIQVSLINLGGVMAPTVARVAGGIATIIGKFGELPASVQTATISVAGIAAAIGPLTGLLGALISPVGLVAVGLAAAGTAAYELYTNVPAAHDAMDAFGKTVKDTVQDLFGIEPAGINAGKGFNEVGAGSHAASQSVYTSSNEIGQTMISIKDSVSAMASGARAIWQQFGGDFTGIAKTIGTGVLMNFRTMAGMMQGSMNILAGVLTGDWSRVWTGIKQIGQTGWNALRGIYELGSRALVQTMQLAGHVLGTALTPAWNLIQSGARAAWGGIMSGVHVLTGLAGTLAGIGRSAMTGFLGGLRAGWNTITGWISQIPGFIRSLLGGAANWLVNIGKDVIDGLKHGMSSAWHGVTSVFSSGKQDMEKFGGGLAGIIKQHAGPIKTEALGIATGIKQPLGTLPEAGSSAGKGLSAGLAAGIDGSAAIAKARAIVAEIKAIMSTRFGSLPYDWAFSNVGDPLVKGIAAGILRGQPAVEGAAAQTKAKLKATLQAQDLINLAREWGPKIGLEHALGIVRGLVAGQPTLLQQARQQMIDMAKAQVEAVKTTTASFRSAFSTLANDALSAFDDRVSRWKAPAQKILDQMHFEDQIHSLTDTLGTQVTEAERELAQAYATGSASAVKTATDNLNAALIASQQTVTQQTQATVDAAKAALDAAQAEGDPEKIAAAQQAYQQALDDQQSALKTHYDTVRTLEETNVQFQIDRQTRLHTELATKQREALAERLTDIQKNLADGNISWDKAHQELIAILNRYLPGWRVFGGRFASNFADGIIDHLGDVRAAAAQMFAAVADQVPHSPAKKGPLSKFDIRDVGRKFASDFGVGLKEGAIPTYMPDVGIRSSGGGGTGYGGRGGSGQTLVVQPQINNPVFLTGDRRAAQDFARFIAPEIERVVKL